MKYSIENITGDPVQRKRAVEFLCGFENETRGPEFWNARLEFWWEKNPAWSSDLPRGWILNYEEDVFGFMGLVPFEYIYQGKPATALAATTWRVDAAHRNASLPMFMKFHRLGQNFLTLDATPNEEVRRILHRFNYTPGGELTSYYFFTNSRNPLWKTAAFLSKTRLPKRKLKIVSIRDSFQTRPQPESNLLRKNITADYLRWYCNSPASQNYFVGCADERGVLQAYLLLGDGVFRGGDALSVTDYFSRDNDREQILALLRCVCEKPEICGTRKSYRAVIFNTFEPQFHDFGRFVPTRRSPGKHFYCLPKELQSVKKKCVLAEGDFGC